MVLGRIPIAHCIQMLRGRPGHNIDALHGKEPRIAHRRAVRRFRITFRQLR